MRWRVGRRPTSRSFAFTSCHGQPVRSARPGNAGEEAVGAAGPAAGAMGRDWFIAAPERPRCRGLANSLQLKSLYAAPRMLQLPRQQAAGADFPPGPDRTNVRFAAMSPY